LTYIDRAVDKVVMTPPRPLLALPLLLGLFVGGLGCPTPRGEPDPTDDDDAMDDDDAVDDDDATDDDDAVDDDDAAPEELDPFAPIPDTSEGLINTSADLEALLEGGTLPGACDRWSGDPADRRDMLLCGKEMFFYEGFDGLGVPVTILDFMGNHFESTIGTGFSNYGLVPDPYSATNRPLGFPTGVPLGGNETAAFGCAQCHFGQLPDGRYAVGYPNLEYDYAALNLALFLAPLKANPFFNPDEHHPDALAKVQPVLDAIDADFGLSLQLVGSVLPLITVMLDSPQLTLEDQRQYASWPPGVLDAILTPAPVDDGVEAPSRILDLWSIPDEAERARFGMDSPLLAWNGDAPDLHTFLAGFVAIADGPLAEWPPERFDPLVEYIRSLRPPTNPTPPAAAQAQEGRRIFDDLAGCGDCHDGPRGQSRTVYDYDVIGTDDAYMYMGDPELVGTPCCGLDEGNPGAVLRHGLKAPRLTGLWAKGKLLHNGSVLGLDDLLCVGGPRIPVTEPVWANHGHEFGCDTLTEEQKADLIAFLETL